MPFVTEHYLLEAFLDGDAYSALADKRRFSTLDNQFNAMTSIIGDGRIDGWEIELLTFPNVRITKGTGFIDQFYVTTFDNQDLVLSPSSTFYFYAQRRVGVTSVLGPLSDVASLTYSDAGPPAIPTGFTASDPTSATVDPFFNAELNWTANTEIDLDHYEIERTTTPPTGYLLVATVDKTLTTYTDPVDEDDTYDYFLYAVDQSGFRSSPTNANHTVLLSPDLPPNPMEVETPPSEGAINVLWKRPVSLLLSKIDHWEVTSVRLNSDSSEITATAQTVIVDKNDMFTRIDNLFNGELYKITIQTVDNKGRSSEGVTKKVSPILLLAPKDPETISAVETELVPGNVVIALVWIDGSDEYDPLIPFRYNIYVTVDGQQESSVINVPIGESDQQIELYTFDGFDFLAIKQNTLITFRLTSVSQNGQESKGNYLRFFTTEFGRPLPVGNLQSVFDADLGKIIVTWDNQLDTSYVHIEILDDDLESDYPIATIVNKNLELVELFRFDSELNHSYTITVTPFDANDVAGPADVTVEVTLISGGVAPPALPRDFSPQAGDRQAMFTWQASSSVSVVSYNIYKKLGTITIKASDWTLLDTVPNTINHFEDFGLENNQIYSYYVTSMDLYGQESLHLPNGAVNLNFIEIIPKASGIIIEPDNVQLSLVGDNILVTWESLLEEFDSFEIRRSVGNLHLWKTIATVDRNTTSYLDENIPLIDGTTFYYAVGKTQNDADIIAQISNISPESSILLGSLVLNSTTFGAFTITGRRDLLDLETPITEFTTARLLSHKHKEIGRFDPDRIDLRPELIVNDWETIDGRIFTTKELDINGTGHVVKINGRFPEVLFEVDTFTHRLIFSEPIVAVDEAGNVTGDLPDIEMRILGVEEVQGVLPASRFDNIHTRQIAFGRLNKEQMPSIDHEGRIRETLLPKTFNLERFSNHAFIIPQENTDSTKNFGDGTTFFSVIEGDGLIDEVIDWDQEDDGASVGFRLPSFATDTLSNLKQGSVDIGEVTDTEFFQSEKSYVFAFEFNDTDSTRWVRITTFDTPIKPNPVLDLKKRLKFKMLTENISVYVSLGVREITTEEAVVGSNGGVVGPIEWVGVDEIITDNLGNTAPKGKLVSSSPDWQEIQFDLEKETVQSFSIDSNGILEGKFGVLEHLAFTIVPEQTNPTGPIFIYIDKLEQVDDVLVSGTSQGILLSRDFGTSWNSVRLVETPVHKFYKAANNPFIWAVGANAVLLATDLENWFETSGLTGVQYIRDIAEDEFGNMYVSTDKGVYWFEIALINNFSSWRQTQPVNAFTTDCYGLYHNIVSSGIDEIWVSTETGIFKTLDQGQTWQDTNMSTQNLPAFQFANISTNTQLPNIICITRKHVLRKLGAETDFSVLANFEVQHDVFDIWVFEYFSDKLYISTGKGIYSNAIDELSTPNIATVFVRMFPGLDINGRVGVAFGLNAVQVDASTNQLFIGQENRIMMADEENNLSIKEQFPNKELPSFFQKDTELNIGYVYNAFNNVLLFRSPQPVNTIYKAAHIPRKIFIPVNDGWAQTNPNSDVFIYVNGLPKWLDFKLDEAQILSELQILQGKLAPIVDTLNDFNSLDPDASIKLDEVIADITNMTEGGTDSSPLINDKTIIKFMEDHTRFLSLITNSVILDNKLDVFPKINVAGFPASLRESNSRAELLEKQEDFIASDSTGITIDIVTGEVDFLTIFTNTTNLNQRLEYVFNKYDKILITIFNANVSNTGEFTHRGLEDRMESVNTGLSSHLTRAHYTNLIKAGIFLETNHHFLFDLFKVSNIQSKFHAAHTSDWYDMLNSTVDYNSILEVNNNAESHFANATQIFTENPYLLDRVWIGTNSDILQYELNTSSGELTLEKSVRPGSGFNELLIWDIFILNEDDIYVVAEEKDSKTGHIFRTVDAGETWSDLDTINLPQKIYKFSILSGNRLAGTENGLFFSDNNFGTWFPANLTLSPYLSDNSPSVAAFTQRVRNIETTTFMIAESDRWFYTSGGGIDWFALAGQTTNNSLSVINKVVRFKSLTWIATDKGLYNDGNSALSDKVQFGLQTELENSSTTSAQLNVSDIDFGVDAFYCSAGTKIYRFLDNVWLNYEVADITSIHKIALRETFIEHWLIIISHNIITTIDVTPGTGVFG